VAYWRNLIEGEGVSVEYRNRIVLLGGLPATHYTFKRDYFLALGDNSGNSYDSRIFGFIPYNNLIGEAAIIYWSREPDGGIRWGRIGKIVR
jgi:signal peptidase I